MSLLFPKSRDQYMQPIRDVMSLWLNQESNITFTAKVGGGRTVEVLGAEGGRRCPSLFP
jgi:hypothetical protein